MSAVVSQICNRESPIAKAFNHPLLISTHVVFIVMSCPLLCPSLLRSSWAVHCRQHTCCSPTPHTVLMHSTSPLAKP
jgi:hypothetical protein